MTAVDLIAGEIVRLRIQASPLGFIFQSGDETSFAFVRFVGTFHNQVVVEDANGRRKLVAIRDVSRIPLFIEEKPEEPF